MHGIEKLVCSTPSMGMNDGYHAGHFPTWESAVLGFSSARELARLRKEVRGSGQTSPALQIPGAKPRPYSNATYDARVSAWAVPFPGEPLQSFKALQPLNSAYVSIRMIRAQLGRVSLAQDVSVADTQVAALQSVAVAAGQHACSCSLFHRLRDTRWI